MTDVLLEKFFSGEEFTVQEVHESLRKLVLAGELVPVLVGSATKNIGVETMLDMFIDYLPCPADLKPYEAKDENGNPVTRETKDSEPFSAYVFKTVVDPYSGVINIIKVCSGVLHVGDEVYYFKRYGKTVRFGRGVVTHFTKWRIVVKGEYDNPDVDPGTALDFTSVAKMFTTKEK